MTDLHKTGMSKLLNTTRMTFLISIILFLFFLVLSSIHIYWAFGGHWGKDAATPTKNNNTKVMSPGPLSTFIVALCLLGFGFFILIEAKILNVPIPLLAGRYGLWIIALIFLVRAIGEFKYVGFFKKIKYTKFGQNDTKYYSPLCLVIGTLTMILEGIK